MSDLGREEIEAYKAGISKVPTAWGDIICDMALAKKDAEGECERLREALQSLVNEQNGPPLEREKDKQGWLSAMEQARELLDTKPPPEGEPCKRCNGRGTTHKDDGICGQFPCKRCDGNGNDPDAPHTSQAPYRKKAMDSDAVLERAARQAHESLRHVHRALGAGAHPTPEQGDVDPHSLGTSDLVGPNAHKRQFDTPEQAHGDALAALEEVMADFQELTGIDPNANPKVRQVRQVLTVCQKGQVGEYPTNDTAICHLDFLLKSSNADHQSLRRCDEVIRRHLTASGVPDHWACKNPGRADQYRAEAMACRCALGFNEESQNVSPSDLTSAIADSGVPEDRESAIWLMAEIMDKFMPKPPGPPDSPFEFQPKFARNALYRQAERAIDNAGESGSGVPYVPENRDE